MVGEVSVRSSNSCNSARPARNPLPVWLRGALARSPLLLFAFLGLAVRRASRWSLSTAVEEFAAGDAKPAA